MATSKITNILFKREFEGKNGKNYIYTIDLEDGTKGDYFSSKNPIDKIIGEDIEYEYEPNSNPLYLGRIKEIKPNKKYTNSRNQKNETAENARFSILVAKELYLAGKVDKAKITEVAEPLFSWLQSKLAEQMY